MSETQPYWFMEFQIPPHMLDGIKLYIWHGIPPGGFLSAIISNDLREAVARADSQNIRNIPAFVNFFYNSAPSQCWGSPEKMRAWIERFAAHTAA